MGEEDYLELSTYHQSFKSDRVQCIADECGFILHQWDITNFSVMPLYLEQYVRNFMYAVCPSALLGRAVCTSGVEQSSFLK